MVRSDGLTLKGALALAYGVPSVRVIGPARLTATRYSFNAVVGDRASESFRSLLWQKLKNRLRLETHVEVRPFDVFVLSATEAPRLQRADGIRQRVWIQERSAQLEDTTMEGFANARQNILGKPVIDETGIGGLSTWSSAGRRNVRPSVAAILRDRFGLQLSEGKRDMEALIVDKIQPDPALMLLEQVGRVTSIAPRTFAAASASCSRSTELDAGWPPHFLRAAKLEPSITRKEQQTAIRRSLYQRSLRCRRVEASRVRSLRARETNSRQLLGGSIGCCSERK